VSTATNHTRTIKGTPFAWQDKRVLRRIREQCEDPASALGTYFALSVAASDSSTEVFQTTHSWLAALSGLSEKTVRNRLADLSRIGAVVITTPKLRAPCTYRLLPFGNSYRTSGNGCRTFGNREAPPLPTSEEKKKRRKAVVRPYQTTVERTAERYRRNGQEAEASRTEEIEETRRELAYQSRQSRE
jgi:hypothetical protein